MNNPGVLSKEDINRLMADRSVKTQVEVVGKLAEHYAAEGATALSTEEVAIANDIFRLLLERANMVVRAMLAMQLSQSDKLPPDLARRMANDVDEVAGPVLQYSEVLSDADLISIINSMTDDKKLQAIAKRDNVSVVVADMLVDTNLDSVVSTLVQNEGANITEQSFEKIAEHFHDNTEVMESIFQRSSIPVAVVEKAMDRLSSSMREHLERKYGNLSEMKALRTTLDQSLELARIRMMGFKSSNKELMRLIQLLNDNNTLSPFSALSLGSLQLFEVSFSRMLRIPVENIHILLQDSVGFKTVYERAGLPKNLLEATELAVNAIRQLEQESLQKSGHKEIISSSQMIDRIHQLSKKQNIKGVDHLCAMMQHIAHAKMPQ